MREWTPTLRSDLPPWELESQWTPESSKGDSRGQNSLVWKVPCIIRKLFEFRFLNRLVWPFGYLKCKLWPKERSGVKLPIWLPTTKSWESIWFPYVQVVCHIPLESSWQGYNFALKLISIGGFHKELSVSKVVRVPILGISRFPFGSFEKKWHLGAGPVARHKYIIRGKVVASPKFGSWWVLWVHVCSWLVHAPKVPKLCINQLFIWFVQICVNNWVTCQSS